MSQLTYLQIRNPKDDETPIESAAQIFASLLSQSHLPLWKRTFIKPRTFAFEIYLIAQTVYFYISTLKQNESFVKSLITSSYPQSVFKNTTDPLELVLKSKQISIGEAVISSNFYLPIKTYLDFKDIDPLSSLIGFLSKQDPQTRLAVQIVVTPASFAWQKQAVNAAKQQAYDPISQKYIRSPQQMLIMRKSSFQGGKVGIRLLAGSDRTGQSLSILRNLAGTFGSFSLGEGNQFALRRRYILKNLLLKRIKERKMWYFERKYQVLNAQELSTIWHPPGYLLAGIKNITWGKTLAGEPPENLPVSDGMNEKDKKDINFFAETEYKNKETKFGIKSADRRKHVYIIGKTGAGKTTLISNMAIDDIRKDRGVGLIDPHGDLANTILDYIPRRRMNDVVYLEPFDISRPFCVNVLETRHKQHKDLIASGIVSIFYKLYGDSWGPRLEYILRNVILTLLEVPNATLVDVLALLSDQNFRQKTISYLKDPVLINFWTKEFAKMPDKLRAEAISPIQNKVGQFVSSRMIRNIIGNPKSTVDLEKIMNEGKILILNLSQGKLGEDNAALLGAMIITQIQLAAMGRAYQHEEERRDFFLYVDEFQSFATHSFIKILSEARKYRLSLTLANQYIDQIDEDVQKAIFGNVGTLVSFVMGARDAKIFTQEYAEIYSENDLVSLGRFEIVTKLSIDGMSSAPFPAKTLPLPSLKNQNREKIIQLSKEKYGRKPTH